MIAKIKSFAEQMWREEKRDLLTELSEEIQQSLANARIELDQLRGEGLRIFFNEGVEIVVNRLHRRSDLGRTSGEQQIGSQHHGQNQ